VSADFAEQPQDARLRDLAALEKYEAEHAGHNARLAHERRMNTPEMLILAALLRIEPKLDALLTALATAAAASPALDG
jgi:hypothetical protein